MRGRSTTYTFELDGHCLDGAVLTCVSSGRNEHWSIDIPTVMWILERVAAGDVDAKAAQDQLRQATLWDSGCCGECDLAAPYYSAARQRHADVVRQWELEQVQLDRDAYPYLGYRGKIHRLSCQRPPSPAPPGFPDEPHAFAILFDQCGGKLDTVFEALAGDRPSRGAQQISLEKVLRMMARDGVAAVTTRLCRTCKPHLPRLDSSASVARPACWAWPAQPAELDQLRANAADGPSTEASTLPEHRVAYAILENWHDGRCAICGEAPTRARLVRDHDHATGLIRGLLCSLCNTAEGQSPSALFDNYRRRPPTGILGVEVLYLPLGFRPGAAHLAPTGSPTGNR